MVFLPPLNETARERLRSQPVGEWANVESNSRLTVHCFQQPPIAGLVRSYCGVMVVSPQMLSDPGNLPRCCSCERIAQRRLAR